MRIIIFLPNFAYIFYGNRLEYLMMKREKSKSEQLRTARQEAALRANLQKRKAQTRARLAPQPKPQKERN